MNTKRISDIFGKIIKEFSDTAWYLGPDNDKQFVCIRGSRLLTVGKRIFTIERMIPIEELDKSIHSQSILYHHVTCINEELNNECKRNEQIADQKSYENEKQRILGDDRYPPGWKNLLLKDLERMYERSKTSHTEHKWVYGNYCSFESSGIRHCGICGRTQYTINGRDQDWIDGKTNYFSKQGGIS